MKNPEIKLATNGFTGRWHNSRIVMTYQGATDSFMVFFARLNDQQLPQEQVKTFNFHTVRFGRSYTVLAIHLSRIAAEMLVAGLGGFMNQQLIEFNNPNVKS